MTLISLTGRPKDEGFSELEINEQLLKMLGKEWLKSLGEGAIILPGKVLGVIEELQGGDGAD
ncbi:MAG: hypothetical protein V3U24_06180 [Candidatus Neomarinimicrobiota bacterium]